MTALSSIETRAAELRNAFDRARAAPFALTTVEQTENLLAIRVSGDRYAIRVSEISGLTADRKIISFPSPIAELLGVAGIRGTLAPVYSLAALLGYGVGAEPIRWLALCGAEESVALAFSEFEGYVRVPLIQVYAAEQEDVARIHVEHVVRAPEMVRAVISIPHIREAIQRRCDNNSVSKER